MRGKHIKDFNAFDWTRFFSVYVSMLLTAAFGGKVGGTFLLIGIIVFVVSIVIEKHERDEREKREIVAAPNYMFDPRYRNDIVCPICGKKTTVFESRRLNPETLLGEISYSCHGCGKDFSFGETFRGTMSKYERRKLGATDLDLETAHVYKILEKDE